MSTGAGPSTSPVNRGLLLQLTAPLQTWGHRSRFNERDTATAPTRSGLIGLMASALGRGREIPLDDLQALRFTVRIDRAGSRLRDFHTVGGGMPRRLTLPTAEGKRRSPGSATLISDRYYLQDAAFTIAVTSGDAPLLRTCAQALKNPRWPLYLGRRSCPPSGPVVLADDVASPMRHLLRLPLSRIPPRRTEAVVVEFTADQPLTELIRAAQTEFPDMAVPDVLVQEAPDDPLSFAPRDRRYHSRTQHRITLRLPVTQCQGVGTANLHALAAYLDHEQEALR